MGEERTVVAAADSEFASKGIVGLFAKYAGLAFVGLLAQGIMVILEGIFIGNGLGTMGLAVVGFVMPLEYFQLALHGCFGIGISTICAEKLGKGDTEGAKKAYTDGMWFSIYLIFALVILIEIFAPQVAAFVGCTPELMGVTTSAIRVFVIFWPFSMIGQIANYMARVAEQPKIGSICVTLAAVIAIIWLWLSIYVFGIGLPVGAAVYYGISIGLFALIIPFLQKRSIFVLKADNMKVSFDNVKRIFKIGFPYLLVQGSTSIFGVVVNNLLGNELDIAAYAVLNGYIIYLLMMVQQASTQGMQPIASFNLGAGMKERVKKVLGVSILGNNIAVYALGLIFILFNKQICGVLCGYDEALTPIVMKYNIMFCIVSGIGFTADMVSGYFQAVEKITFATILGLSRYIIFGIPCMFIFKAVMGAEGVWYGQGASYVFAFILTMIMVIIENKRLGAKK
ncbi:MAG: MATE family efflux transporter [Hespellia sp.]|nr:MATE family efflux transporter [Hespellia sp.]